MNKSHDLVTNDDIVNIERRHIMSFALPQENNLARDFSVWSDSTCSEARTWLTTQPKDFHVAGLPAHGSDASPSSLKGALQPAIRLVSRSTPANSYGRTFTKAAFFLMLQNDEGLPCHLDDRLSLVQAIQSDDVDGHSVGNLLAASSAYVETERLRQEARNPFAREWEDREDILRPSIGGNGWRAIRTVLAHLPRDFAEIADVPRMRFSLEIAVGMLSRQVETAAFREAIDICLNGNKMVESYDLPVNMRSLFLAAGLLLIEKEEAEQGKSGSSNDASKASCDGYLQDMADSVVRSLMEASDRQPPEIRLSPKSSLKAIFNPMNSVKEIFAENDAGFVGQLVDRAKERAGEQSQQRMNGLADEPADARLSDTRVDTRNDTRTDTKKTRKKGKRHHSMGLASLVAKKKTDKHQRTPTDTISPRDLPESQSQLTQPEAEAAPEPEEYQRGGRMNQVRSSLKQMLQKKEKPVAIRANDSNGYPGSSEELQISETNSEGSAGANKRLTHPQILALVPEDIVDEFNPNEWNHLVNFFEAMNEIESLTRQRQLDVVIPSTLSRSDTRVRHKIKANADKLLTSLNRDEDSLLGLKQTLKTLISFIS